jgi:hypothetical protein
LSPCPLSSPAQVTAFDLAPANRPTASGHPMSVAGLAIGAIKITNASGKKMGVLNLISTALNRPSDNPPTIQPQRLLRVYPARRRTKTRPPKLRNDGSIHQHFVRAFTRFRARHLARSEGNADCQKLSLQPPAVNAPAQYQRRPRFRDISWRRHALRGGLHSRKIVQPEFFA